jgi:hypothetical protein
MSKPLMSTFLLKNTNKTATPKTTKVFSDASYQPIMLGV